MTTILDGDPYEVQLVTPPAGTPSQMTAQKSIPPEPYASRMGSASETMQVDDRQIEASADERHDALHPTASRLVIDEIVPTLVRAPSAPRIEMPPPQPARYAPETLDGKLPWNPTPAPAKKQSGPLVAVLLVLLAAAIAATAVYFTL
jgi:hypothetical protein